MLIKAQGGRSHAAPMLMNIYSEGGLAWGFNAKRSQWSVLALRSLIMLSCLTTIHSYCWNRVQSSQTSRRLHSRPTFNLLTKTNNSVLFVCSSHRRRRSHTAKHTSTACCWWFLENVSQSVKAFISQSSLFILLQTSLQNKNPFSKECKWSITRISVKAYWSYLEKKNTNIYIIRSRVQSNRKLLKLTLCLRNNEQRYSALIPKSYE